ncbi:MAG: 2-phospho-L-lactate transferase [Burkholderiales bacterium]|nr:2-phospho-L-lactate transferase [Burkholderiales bacterium]
MTTSWQEGKVLALSGGIGGAKLVLGLAHVLPAGALTVAANVADDFEHLGLAICPDLDTLVYTLAGLADPERGWGRRDETWTFMSVLATLGGATWFRLGDGDLALHAERTRRLAAGESLSDVIDDIRQRLGVATRVLPVSDDPVRTRVRTHDGWLAFQEYFVRRRCEPTITRIAFDGAASACAHPALVELLHDPTLRAVVICPSNPLISIDPLLAVEPFRRALALCRAPVIGVSPIIGGRAVKGPTAKMMGELGIAIDAMTAARHYGDLLDGYVIDEADAATCATDVDMPVRAEATLMRTVDDKMRLARAVLEFADELSSMHERAFEARR